MKKTLFDKHWDNLGRENRLNPNISGRKLNARRARRQKHWMNVDEKFMFKHFGDKS